MDVKTKSSVQPSNPLLQKGVPRPAASPQPRLIDGYIDVRKPTSQLPGTSLSGTPSFGTPLSGTPQLLSSLTPSSVRSTPNSSGSKTAEPDAAALTTTDCPQNTTAVIHASIPGDPPVLVNPTEEQLVRSTLAAMMARNSGERILNRKHWYTIAGPTSQTSGTEVGFVLNAIPVGTTASGRTGPAVKNHRVVVRVWAWFHNITDTTANTSYGPMMRFCLKRTMVPATPGTTEIAFATDSNPPAVASAVWSGLGQAPSAVPVLAVMVFNPISKGRYHAYNGMILPPDNADKRASEVTPGGISSATATTYIVTPKAYFFEFVHDFDFMSYYTTTSGANPVSNQLELTWMPVHTANQDIDLMASTDLEFEDVVTG